MSELAPLFLLCAVIIALPIGWAYVRQHRRRRYSRQASRRTRDDACAACSATDIVWVGDGAYVCSCGYEGGPGFALYDWSRTCARMDELSEEERRALTAKHAAQALETLKAGRHEAVSGLEHFHAAMAKSAKHRGDDLIACSELIRSFSLTMQGALPDMRALHYLATGEPDLLDELLDDLPETERELIADTNWFAQGSLESTFEGLIAIHDAWMARMARYTELEVERQRSLGQQEAPEAS